MRGRIFRHISTVASLLLLVTVPTQASPIKFADVVNVMGDLHRGQQNEQLRLRVTQDPAAPLNVKTNVATSNATGVSPATDENVVAASNELAGTENSSTTTSLVAGTDIAPQQPQGDVQVFDQDQVSGTICDCGEIPAVCGGFPKWPFLLLIPLVCLTGVCFHDDEKKKIPPTPTPTPEVPEPASLLLLGSGIAALSAGARRRYAKMKAAKEAATMAEV